MCCLCMSLLIFSRNCCLSVGVYGFHESTVIGVKKIMVTNKRENYKVVNFFLILKAHIHNTSPTKSAKDNVQLSLFSFMKYTKHISPEAAEQIKLIVWSVQSPFTITVLLSI